MSVILGIKSRNREDCAVRLQKILTKHGCFIDTRIGLHYFGKCSDFGLILLSINDDEKAVEIEAQILEIPETETQRMIFKTD